MILELCFAYSCKNIKKPVISSKILNNKKLNISILILLLIGIVIYITPIKFLFNLTTISSMEFLYCLMVVLVMIVIDELLKPVLSKKFKD